MGGKETYKHPRPRLPPTTHPRQLPPTSPHQHISPRRVPPPQPHQPPQIPLVAPRLVHQPPHHRLAEPRRPLARHLRVPLVALHQLRRGSEPPQPGAWDRDLGEGVKAEDAAVGVEGEVRRGERGEELGRGFRLRRGRGDTGGRELQKVVRLVLDDEQVVALRDGVDGAAALRRLQRARGVLPRGDRVKDVRLAGAAAGRRVPGGEEGVERVGEEALGVGGDAEDVRAEGVRGFERRREGVFFG